MGSIDMARAQISPVTVRVHCDGCFRIVRLVIPADYTNVDCPTKGCSHSFYLDIKVMERA